MRVTAVIAITLLALCVALYWIPLPPIKLDDTQLILGGYPWQAPTPQARGFFVTMGVALTVAAIILAALAAVFGRESNYTDNEDFD